MMIIEGHVTSHMAAHIVVLNVAAPLVSLAWRRLGGPGSGLARLMVPAAALQLVLFFGWHTPSAMAWTGAHPLGEAVMHLSLAVAALCFWRAAIEAAPPVAIGALLVTGKVFCLLGVLLAFAPRPIYPGHAPEALLADQQLAGLMMLVACPLTYLLAAVVIAARWLAALERQPTLTAP